MRAPKFRAHNKKKGFTLSVECIDIDPYGNKDPYIRGLTEDGRANITWNLNQVDLYQFSGFKDDIRTEEFPDGQDIYAGDVIEYDLISPAPGIDRIQRRLIVFTEGAFYVACQPDILLSKFLKIYDVEVIGRIYENPKLILQGKVKG